ncbi:hypothetical protein P152DRAFT_331097 [Eremomyces bilateralis CBS 781.70]|uniref:Uncharacterized protein n=1 Tax=Eremomyces bilateralis CBS 781.70 TaxID=1392243 RepID=A0A6G1G4U1_9PEZI|nr:uncharacterized protein P152DRAFT_331097 [Eremomyces bilateralis CBS 781.70]KAF1812930.1 hypothetical protein P152DRAFT_331097 [Eremomyces bilateralis CBS 781.70]
MLIRRENRELRFGRKGRDMIQNNGNRVFYIVPITIILLGGPPTSPYCTISRPNEGFVQRTGVISTLSTQKSCDGLKRNRRTAEIRIENSHQETKRGSPGPLASLTIGERAGTKLAGTSTRLSDVVGCSLRPSMGYSPDRCSESASQWSETEEYLTWVITIVPWLVRNTSTAAIEVRKGK